MLKAARMIILMLATTFVLSGCISADDTGGTDNVDVDGTGGETGNETSNMTIVVLQESLTWAAGVTGCGGIFFQPADGVDHASLEVPAKARGGAINATFTAEEPVLTYAIGFWDGSNEYIDQIDSTDPELSGTVPENAANLIAFTCGGTSVGVDITVTGANEE